MTRNFILGSHIGSHAAFTYEVMLQLGNSLKSYVAVYQVSSRGKREESDKS